MDFERKRLFSGYDGRTCKVVPQLATDGQTTLLSWMDLKLTGSDVFCGTHMARSEDGGRTFGAPKAQERLCDTVRDGIRTAYTGEACYSRVHRRWYGLGYTSRYADDRTPLLIPGTWLSAGNDPLFLTVDEKTGEFTSYSRLQVPFACRSIIPFGQPVELPEGDVLVSFYYNTAEEDKYLVSVVRYAFTPDGLEPVAAGEPMRAPELGRGLCEPSLAAFGGKYYLTLRTDERGMWAESEDGLNFAAPRPWVWEDGTEIGNYNTQQHWLRSPEGLWLAYTRRAENNGHVFRHRAPIFAAPFDAERGCLIRDKERILVPELGARLGNFCTVDVSDRESWLITAEWMQPSGCEKYGSDNPFWLVRIFWDK